MNITKSLFALLVAGAMFTGCKDSAKEPMDANANDTAAKTEAPVGKIETASFNIEGMTCAIGCAKTIESKLSKMDGVKSANVDFDKKTATVEFDSAKQSPEKLAVAVEAVADGKTYKVSNMKSSGDHAMLVNKEKKKKKGDKKESCAADKGGKPACCSAKKGCHGEKSSM
ncbi:MAG: heavy-metal-associated domain-containing protein [Flavobacterium sp.]|nr:MAG: heavy-metal-associated domain-containing protein [Flavobacterium sp.]